MLITAVVVIAILILLAAVIQIAGRPPRTDSIPRARLREERRIYGE